MTLSVLSPKTLLYGKTRSSRLGGTTPSGEAAPSPAAYAAAMAASKSTDEIQTSPSPRQRSIRAPAPAPAPTPRPFNQKSTPKSDSTDNFVFGAPQAAQNDAFASTALSGSGSGSGSSSDSSLPVASQLAVPPLGILSGLRTPSPIQDPAFTPPMRTPSTSSLSTIPRSSSFGARSLSEKIKATPASYVRHSRVYSSSDFAFLDHHLNGGAPATSPLAASPYSASPRVPSPRVPTSLHNRIHASLSPELSPIVNLLNAQTLRTYTSGFFQVPGVLNTGERAWFEVEAKLTGHELAFWRPAGDEYVVENGNDEFTPKYINLTDAKVEVVSTSPYQIRILQDWQEHHTWLIQFHNAPEFYEWLAAIYLSKYEYIALNEAFTAVVLSTKASNLSDMHVLLSSKKRFAHHEWCNLRLPQVSNNWLKVFVVVSPGDSKKLGRIEIYNSDKISKKNLLVYISNVVGVFNVFPEHAAMIDLNAIMKINGDIYINRAHENLFSRKEEGFRRTASGQSLSSLPNSPVQTKFAARSTSFFEGAPILDPSEIKKRGNRSRSSSTSRSTSTPALTSGLERSVSQFVKKNNKSFVQAEYLYLMPVAHPGVPAVETMIRNFIQIIDVFKLYGRPEHFVSDKTDPRSMLFGLPSLPHYQYLSIDDVTSVVANNLQDSITEQWGEHNWIGAVKQHLSNLIGSSSSERTYSGSGDILKLYSELDVDFVEVSSPCQSLRNATSSNTITNVNPFNADFDDFSDQVSTPPAESSNASSELVLVSELGTPIQLNESIAEAPAQNFQNLRLHENYKGPVAPPIVEAHPYSSLVS